MKMYFVLMYPTGDYVHIDNDSGYPYPTVSPNKIHFFKEYNKAKDYSDKFPDRAFTIHSVEFTIIKVE